MKSEGELNWRFSTCFLGSQVSYVLSERERLYTVWKEAVNRSYDWARYTDVAMN
jgi:hypothetical protein